jgi:hypothetical protein
MPRMSYDDRVKETSEAINRAFGQLNAQERQAIEELVGELIAAVKAKTNYPIGHVMAIEILGKLGILLCQNGRTVVNNYEHKRRD